MRRFTYSDATSNKFWAIDLKGNAFTVTYGKVGAAGQSQTKTFPTPDKARAEAEKLIKEKTGKGYVEEGVAQAAPKSDREVLEAAVLANPEDRAAHAALADFLLEQGDPMGEFVRTQLALEDESLKAAERKKLKEKEAALSKAHQREWLGPLAEVVLAKKKKGDGREPPRATFVRGLLARVEFPRLRVDEARAFVASPASATVRELLIGETAYEEPGTDYEPGPDTRGGDEEGDSDAALRVLGRWKHLGNLRVFRLGEPVEEDYKEDPFYGFSSHTSGALAPGLVRQMPNVEELYLLCNRWDTGKVFNLPMPRLRVLQVYHADKYPFDKLARNASLGNLTHLLCHPHALDAAEGAEHAYIRLAGLKAICRSPHLKSLTHLRLRIADFGNDGVAEIIKSGLIKRLKVLDLRHGVVTDEGAEQLANCPAAKNLELIDLSYNTLTAAGVAALKRAKLKFTAGQQWARSGDEYEDNQWLYAGDIE